MVRDEQVKNPPAMQVQSLVWEDPLEEQISSILAWEIPWKKEPGVIEPEGLQSQTRLSDRAHASPRYAVHIYS